MYTSFSDYELLMHIQICVWEDLVHQKSNEPLFPSLGNIISQGILYETCRTMLNGMQFMLYAPMKQWEFEYACGLDWSQIFWHLKIVPHFSNQNMMNDVEFL